MSDEEFTKLLSNHLINAKGFYDYGIKNKLTSPEDVRLTIAARKETAKALIDGGVSRREAAKLLGVDESTIRADVRENPAENAGKSRTPKWSEDQRERRRSVESGQCVVANMRDDTDEALIEWAKTKEVFVRIDRNSDWGNPFEIPQDGERPEVIAKFSKFYLPNKPGLLAAIDSGALRGKVLCCWCHPEECHGHILSEIVNKQLKGKNSAQEIADKIAEVDA